MTMDTSTVFALRKSGKLLEALTMALALYKDDPYDEWVQKALAWPLIDLCKKAMIEGDLKQAQIYLTQLTGIAFSVEDDIIFSQIKFLYPKVDMHYTVIQAAEELSKSGSHKEAFAKIQALILNNQLSEIHHEAYGWIIYRYLKAEAKNITPVAVRTLLRDYINLKNDRPSLLHSIILSFALQFSKEHPELNIYNFFLLWGPKNLRDEDVRESTADEKTYPSLISRVFREFIDKKYPIDINLLINEVCVRPPFHVEL